MQRCVLESMKDAHIRSSRPRGCHDSRASNRPPTAILAGFMTYLMYAREGDEPLRLALPNLDKKGRCGPLHHCMALQTE